MKKRLLFAVLAVAVLIAQAGCSGGGGDNGNDTGIDTVTDYFDAADTTVDIEQEEDAPAEILPDPAPDVFEDPVPDPGEDEPAVEDTLPDVTDVVEEPEPELPVYPTWSFAVTADPRSNTLTWRNALIEIRDLRENPAPAFSKAEFLLIAGDVDPNSLNYLTYNNAFGSDPIMNGYYPAIGNHDYETTAERNYIQNTILPAQPNITRYSAETADYFIDWKNIRVIVVDAYAEFGDDGCVFSDGLAWVESVINTAVAARHIFIMFHDPAFPRFRHVGDSFNACPVDRNAFWNMLVDHKDKVRAVFVGHTHQYCRMRVLDPDSEAANDLDQYPDDEGGIYQIDAGAAGNGDRNVIIRLEINGDTIMVRVLDADNGLLGSFEVVETFELLH